MSRIFRFLLILPVSLVPETNTRSIPVADLRGLINPTRHPDFEAFPEKLSLRKGIYLRREAVTSLKAMLAAAEKNGIRLRLLSGTRTFAEQREIWNAKFRGNRPAGGVKLDKSMKPADKVRQILRYSSMPGTSRHHWGTDADLALAAPGDWLSNETWKRGEGLRAYNWLQQNAGRFGFCAVYSDSPALRNPGKAGYEEERWHYSYMPLSRKYLDAYLSHASALRPDGFDGSAEAASLYLDYVTNISPACASIMASGF